MEHLITYKHGSEAFLLKETALYGGNVQSKGQGWALVSGLSSCDLCFASNVLENPSALTATSINNMAEQLSESFIKHISDKKIIDVWPYLLFSTGNENLIPRVKTVEKCWMEKLMKKIPRVAKLGRRGIPLGFEFMEGFFVHFTDFNNAFVSFNALNSGQKRMEMDPHAPSRSFLKLEEAFLIFGQAPQKGETVFDLGASPGGWSYSALNHGAAVFAIDKGPLKEPVKSHPMMTQLKVDALKFNYTQKEPVDWLLCDILDQPEFTLDMLHKWITRKWCRHFIVNVKLSRSNPIKLIKEINDPKKGLRPYCKELRIRELYHDREEITLMGEAKD